MKIVFFFYSLKDAWNVRRPPELLIQLKPQESQDQTEAHVSVDLYIKCADDYPEKAPYIEIRNAKGLADLQVATLHEDVLGLSRKLVGEEMIYELCQHVQKTLHSCNQPPAQSFYEQMLRNKQQKQEQLAQEEQRKVAILRRKEEKQKQLIEDEIKKRQTALREQNRMEKEAENNIEENGMQTPISNSNANVVLGSPIPFDTEQRDRRGNSLSPEGTPVRQLAISESASHHKQQRRRRTSTQTSESSDTSEYKPTATATCIIAFNSKIEQMVYKGWYQ